MLAASVAADSIGVMTALAGLIGAIVAAYKLLKTKEPEAEEPEAKHEHDHVSDTHNPADQEIIQELRSALSESRQTVHSLRRRLDLATGVETEDKKDWLSGS